MKSKNTLDDPLRIGIDLGGTKIAGVLLGPLDDVLEREHCNTPRDDYGGTIRAIRQMVDKLDASALRPSSVGVGMPGSIAPQTGLVQNANSTWLNDQPFQRNLAQALGRPVACANDANCFVLSETHDGAAVGADSVFGVILGTGCGGGLILRGGLVNGRRNIGGEWGHNPLPWQEPDEIDGPPCWCGKSGCIEAWISGPGLERDHWERELGAAPAGILSAEAIVVAAAQGDLRARITLQRHASRLARSLAHVVNIFDPDIIVLGGGLSSLRHLYEVLPGLMAPYIFAADKSIDVRPPKWGSASGVRGAARLWDEHQ